MASPGVVPPDVLGVLKGFDPDVEEVLASSGHVSLYTMAVESQQWTRKDVEGSLFLLKRRGTPRFRMMVLNKLSTENYFEDIHGGLDFELNPPYLMYTHGNSEIIGVWFYEQEDLHRVENVLMRIKQANQMSKPATSTRTQTAARPTGSKADDDNFYDKPNAGGAPANVQHQQQHQPVAHSPVAPAAPADGASNLATLLRNATLKQQQQQQATEQTQQAAATSSSALPHPLPPSFFSQPQRAAQPTAPPPQAHPFPLAAAPTQVPAPAAAGPHATPAAQPQPRGPQVLVQAAVTSDQQQPAGGQMGGALAKLFANAHKSAAAQPQAQAASPLPPSAAPQPAAQAAASPPGVHQQQQLQAAGSVGGVSDEERVRRLLARIATNDALVKMLAVELRSVGML